MSQTLQIDSFLFTFNLYYNKFEIDHEHEFHYIYNLIIITKKLIQSLYNFESVYFNYN